VARDLAGVDGVERREERRLVGRGGGARLPGPRHATTLDRRDVVRVFGKRPARAAPTLDLDLDEGAALRGVVAPRSAALPLPLVIQRVRAGQRGDALERDVLPAHE